MTTLEQLHRVQIRAFVKAGAFSQSVVHGTFEFPDKPGTISFRTDLERMTIEFTATAPDGDQVVSRLGLVRKPTNLGKGNTWLFRSFRTGKLCRVLYLVRGMFVARADIIGPRYTQQLKGRTGRMWLRYNRYQTPPTRAKGKTTYRGKLTPYGKRLERYDLLADDLYLDTIVYMARRYKIWRDIPSLEPLKDLDL